MTEPVDLFSELELGPLQLPNRIVMAPMTRNRAGPGNVPTELMAEYYRQRAGAGLIISEASQVSPQGMGYPATPGIHSAEQVAGWQGVTETVHAAGGRIFLQLWHVGRISHPSLQPDGAQPVAPSAICPHGEAMTYEGPKPFVTPRALALEEIPGIIESYRTGAENALAAGFDGVEIHGANGYLLDQFLRSRSNHRVDAYGGSLENRARLLLEVTEAVCDVWGGERVGLRLSPVQPFNDMYDATPCETFVQTVQWLNDFGLAYLHITRMGKDNPGLAGPDFDFAELRTAWNGVYMTNFGYDKILANAELAAGEADLVAFGVPYLANPDLPERLRQDAALNTPDPDSFYGGDARGYTDYPFLDATA